MSYFQHNGSGILLPESIRESLHASGLGADWREPVYDDSQNTYIPLHSPESDQYDRAGFETEQELQFARRVCRYLARKSAYCINGHENRVSYIVGYGHSYKVVGNKVVASVDKATVTAAQSVIDTFIRVNKWNRRQQETVRRRDRDGECFLRLFDGNRDGILRVRFVEPNQISTPTGNDCKHIRLGIEHHPEDVETTLAYWIDGKRVDATEIQHRKGHNVDSNVVRGMPLFWPVIETLRSIPKIRNGMLAGSVIQSGVAFIRHVEGATKAAMKSLQDDVSAQSRLPLMPNGTLSVRPEELSRPGRILNSSSNISYEFPFSSTRYDQYIAVVADNLREVASLLVMPEFMLTSDASNANYASTMVAEGPAVKMFERLQNSQIEEDLEVMDRVLQTAVKAGRLPEGIEQLVEIECEPPSMVVRDTLQEAQEMQIYSTMQVMSPQTIAQRLSLDYDQEQANLAAHDEAYGASNPILPPGEGGTPTGNPFGSLGESRRPAWFQEWVQENCGTGAGGFGSGNTCSGGGGGGNGGGKKRTAKQKKRTIQGASKELKKKGYEISGVDKFDLENKTARYKVKGPDGETRTMTSGDIEKLLDGDGPGPEKSPGGKPKPGGDEPKAKSYKSGKQAEDELSASTKVWRDGLDFDDTAGIKAYAGSSTSFDVNKGLREGKFPNPTAKVTAERMTKALDKADFPDTVTTHRAINPKTPEEREAILSKFRKAQGGEVIDKAFVSTTANKKYADTWGKNSSTTPIRCEVVVPKGSKAAYLPKDMVGRQEWEVVIQKNSKYRVKSVVGDTIQLELLK